MGPDQLSWGLLALLGALLLVAAVTDLRSRIISNRLNLTIALLAPLFWWAQGMPVWPAMALQALLALVVLMLFAAAFWRGWMGGGDVKLLGALALWLPLVEMIRVIFVMSLAGGVVTLIAYLGHRLRRHETAAVEVPYGVAIAFAGMWALAQRYLNQFA